ncbi:MAG: germination protein YpeB [Acutalibacteraceae bacterium]|nr:germination protein YpeB [Acutalibacteraceae bacterium]
MRVRTRVRLISFISGAVAVILGAGITGYNLANTYRTTIQYTYQRSLSQLSDYFSSIKTTLSKGEYANTAPQQYGLASKLMVEAEGAKDALSELPISQSDSEGIQKYLTQVSDFASFTIGVLSRNEKLSDDNIESLKKLSDYADTVAPRIEELSARFGDGSEYIGKETNQLSSNIETENETEKTAFDNSFLTVSESFADYPSLIYDGPFSDSVQQKTAKLTETAQGYSVEQARNIMAEFINKDYNEIQYVETRTGNLPVYVFEGDNFYGTVTVKGGYVCEMYFTNHSQTPKDKYSYDESLSRAKEFLKQRKLENMEENYYVTENAVCTINFAYKEQDVTCYGDLIKIGVSTTTGKIISYNAEGYIMNHTNREIAESKLSASKAQKSVSSSLNVVKEKKALIPVSNGKEIFCYEFTCTGKDDENVIVYINADTGLEEQIYILLQSDNGTLVM